MRSLIASLLVLVFLVGCWFCFYRYSDKELHQLVNTCEKEVMPAIEAGEWDHAYNTFQKQYTNWHRYKKWALFMLETEKINDTDANFAKTLMYIKAKDLSNSSGELLALKESIKVLHENESIALSNIL